MGKAARGGCGYVTQRTLGAPSPFFAQGNAWCGVGRQRERAVSVSAKAPCTAWRHKIAAPPDNTDGAVSPGYGLSARAATGKSSPGRSGAWWGCFHIRSFASAFKAIQALDEAAWIETGLVPFPKEIG